MPRAQAKPEPAPTLKVVPAEKPEAAQPVPPAAQPSAPHTPVAHSADAPRATTDPWRDLHPSRVWPD